MKASLLSTRDFGLTGYDWDLGTSLYPLKKTKLELGSFLALRKIIYSIKDQE